MKISNGDLLALLVSASKDFYGVARRKMNKSVEENIAFFCNDENLNKSYLWILDEMTSFSIKLGSLQSTNSLGRINLQSSSIYHLNAEQGIFEKINMDSAIDLIKVFPSLPVAKTRSDFLNEVSKEFDKYGLKDFLDEKDLFFSLEKARLLSNDVLSNYLLALIEEDRKFLVRDSLVSTIDCSFESLDDFYKTIRPIMLELNFPEKFINHKFTELLINDRTEWDFVIASQIEKMSKKELAYIKLDAEKLAGEKSFDDKTSTIDQNHSDSFKLNSLGKVVLGLLGFFILVNVLK